MDFSLSSSLVGSAVSNPDKLALDLQFATDKTLTARKGPTPVFTRGSGATFVDSDKLVKYAPENLMLQSEDLATTWSISNAAILSNVTASPAGLITADKIIENTSNNVHGADQASTLTPFNYTFSLYAKKSERIWIRMFFGGLSPTWFNIDTGTIGTIGAGITASITDAGNNWWRCSITGIPTNLLAGIHGFRIATDNNIVSYLGDGTSGVFIWGAQLERSSAARTYNPTTTAAFYGPRFDHDPVTSVCKGLLMEESRTNNSWYSGAIVSGTGWLAAQTTSVIDGVGPDGNNAYTLTEDTVTNVHAVSNTGGAIGTAATSIVSGTVYTGSIFLKKVSGSVDWVQLLFGTAGFGATQYANFNLNTGTVGNSAGLTAGFPPRIEAFANGWYRCSITATATATTSTSNNLTVGFVNNINTTIRLPSYAGSTASKVLATMCQFETGLFATSYIPTVAASGVRSADVCSISGSGFTSMWNAIEGSLSSSVVFNAPISNATGQLVVDVNDTTTANRLRYFRNPTTGTSGFANTSNSTTNVIMTGTVLQPFIMQRFSAGFKLDDYAFYVNNSQVAVDNLGALLVSPTTLTIGDSSAGAARQYTNGTISSIRYYKKRLPNAKLQTITV